MLVYGIVSYVTDNLFCDPSDVTFKCFQDEEERDLDFIRMAQDELKCHEFDPKEWNKTITTVEDADEFYERGDELGLAYIQKRVVTELIR